MNESENHKWVIHKLNTQSDHLNNIYQQYFIIILDKLMFNQAHIKSKMCAALTKDE